MSDNKLEEGYFQPSRDSETRRSAVQVLSFVNRLLSPNSVADVGCGVGTWLSVFQEFGVDHILGIDGSYLDQSLLQIPRDCFLEANLTDPPEVADSFDLVMSLEVAEHLPEESAATFIRFLTSLAPAVLFSAAIPGQGGFMHIHERWQSYWVQHFANNGYELVNAIHPAVWTDDVLVHYAQNGMLFFQSDYLKKRPELVKLQQSTSEVPVDVIHPKLWDYARNYPAPMPGVKRMLRHFPVAVMQGVKRRLFGSDDS